jgi:hypothetical protein
MRRLYPQLEGRLPDYHLWKTNTIGASSCQSVPRESWSVAQREPHNWAELRHALFKMNGEFARFEKYDGSSHNWEAAPQRQ